MKASWYGPATLAAVVAFQKSQGLPAKGIVGAPTWRALIAPKATARKAAATRTGGRGPARGAPHVGSGHGGSRPAPPPVRRSATVFGAARSGHSHQGMDPHGTPRHADPRDRGRRRSSARAVRATARCASCSAGRSGSKFYYGHMSKDLSTPARRAKRGQVIGLMATPAALARCTCTSSTGRAAASRRPSTPSRFCVALC